MGRQNGRNVGRLDRVGEVGGGGRLPAVAAEVLQIDVICSDCVNAPHTESENAGAGFQSKLPDSVPTVVYHIVQPHDPT